MSSEVFKARSQLATLGRKAVAASPEQVDAAKRNLAVAKIADYVQKVVSAAPPLSDDQLTAIASLLRAANRGAAAEARTGGGA